MTLKTSFSKVMKEDMKRRIWPIVLFSLLCFLAAAAFELELEGYLSRGTVDIMKDIYDLTEHGLTATYLFFAGIGACLFGFQGFFWLTKRDQVDFYHSQPVKREKRFLAIYLNGVILFEIPMLLYMAACSIFIGLRGYFTREILVNMLINVLIYTVSFLVMYHLVILAMMITGNVIVSMMIAGILGVYPTVIRLLTEGFFANYFDTYTYSYGNKIEWIGYFSPLERIFRCAEFRSIGSEVTGQFYGNILILVGMAIVVFAMAFLLYKKRPSEAAGRALAFPKAGDLIRFLIVIPAGMFFGIMFVSFGTGTSVFWLFFGTIVGALLAHGFMEVIFHFDIKAALGKKIQLLASMVLVLGIVSVFCFDLFGYDSFLPEEDQLKSVAYYINIGEMNSDYYELNEEGVPLSVVAEMEAEEALYEGGEVTDKVTYSSGKIYYNRGEQIIYREDYQMAHSETEDVKQILALVEAYMEEKTIREAYEKGTTVEDSLMGTYDIASSELDYEMSEQMVVCYKMKNGQKIYREYQVPNSILKEYYSSIYETAEGKELIHPYMNLSSEEMDRVSVYAPHMVTEELDLTEEEIGQLLDCYKKDLEEQTMEELLDATCLGEMDFIYELPPDERGDVEDLGLKVFVCENYEYTLSFLKEKGISLKLPGENFEITKAIAHNPYDFNGSEDNSFWKGRDQVELTLEEIDQVLPYLKTEDYHGRYYVEDGEYFVTIVLTVRNLQTGSEKEAWYMIYSKDLPEEMRAE